MSNLIVVGISDMKVTWTPDRLVTYALGSCVGTCLYDAVRRVAGLSHVLLPDSGISREDRNIMKYADTAIEELVRRMELAGASRSRLVAKIAGGANMFASSGISIGERNVRTVKEELRRLRIILVAEDTGSNYGRTLEFSSEDGSMLVRSVLHGSRVL